MTSDLDTLLRNSINKWTPLTRSLQRHMAYWQLRERDNKNPKCREYFKRYE